MVGHKHTCDECGRGSGRGKDSTKGKGRHRDEHSRRRTDECSEKRKQCCKCGGWKEVKKPTCVPPKAASKPDPYPSMDAYPPMFPGMGGYMFPYGHPMSGQQMSGQPMQGQYPVQGYMGGPSMVLGGSSMGPSMGPSMGYVPPQPLTRELQAGGASSGPSDSLTAMSKRALDQATIVKLFGQPNPAFYPPKPFFDTAAFAGTWYEIARCSGSAVGDACAKLVYQWQNINDTTIGLAQTCTQSNGSTATTIAYGLPHPYDAWSYFVDPTGKYISSTGEILVNAIPPGYVASPNFLIKGTDYKNYAVVSDRDCLRMLSRYQTVSQADFDYVRNLIKYPGSAMLNHIDDGAISASAPNRVAPQ